MAAVVVLVCFFAFCAVLWALLRRCSRQAGRRRLVALLSLVVIIPMIAGVAVLIPRWIYRLRLASVDLGQLEADCARLLRSHEGSQWRRGDEGYAALPESIRELGSTVSVSSGLVVIGEGSGLSHWGVIVALNDSTREAVSHKRSRISVSAITSSIFFFVD